MRAVWYNYPWALFAGAMSTTLGGVLTVVLSLNVGASAAFWALDTGSPDVIGFIFSGIIAIGMSCFQVWGFVYLAFLIWQLHRLVYADASRWWAAIILAPLQFMMTMVMIVLSDFSWYSDEVVRAIGAFVIILLPLCATLLVRRLMRGKPCA